MITDNTLRYFEEILTSSLKEEVRIFSFRAVGGGDINAAYKLETNYYPLFVKMDSASRYPEMFVKEASGLRLLAQANCIRTPKVILEGEHLDKSFLILEYLESKRPQNDFWFKLGSGLAKLHMNTSDQFGLDDSNYIGSLRQFNDFKDDWLSFFIEERLLRQIKLAKDSNSIDNTVLSAFERLFKVLNEIIPEEPVALLHGDLWSGNYMVDEVGDPVLIDPAVYYGHREMDLAMTCLFGGFSSDFYKFYNETYPLEKGWESRMDICNLYPLLVHLNLFGSSYLHQVNSILRRF